MRPGLLQADLGYFQVSDSRIRPVAMGIPFNPNFEISVILVTASMVTAECKEFWQLLLCQGILTGFACGMNFGPAPAIVSQWFDKRRPLAFAIISIGSSLGGAIFPIIARNLIELIGYASEFYTRVRLMASSVSSGQCGLSPWSNSSCSLL